MLLKNPQIKAFSCGLFCKETMIFTAKMNRDEVVATAISYIFVLHTCSRWMLRFREKWEKCIYLRVFFTRKLWVLEQKCIEMKLFKMTFPLFLYLIPLLLDCTDSEIFDVFGFSWNFDFMFHDYRRFLDTNTAFLPKLATFLPKNRKFPRFWA